MTHDRSIAQNVRISQREARLRFLFRIIVTTVACAGALAGLRSVYERAARGYGLDFYQFWLGGDVLRTHQAQSHHDMLDVYSDASHYAIGKQYLELARSKSVRQRRAAAERNVVDTASSPFFYWVFSRLAPGDYDRDYRAYILFSMAAMVGTITLVAWRLRYSLAAIAAAIVLAAISAPVYSDTDVANLNFPEVAICMGYLLLRERGKQSSRFTFAWFTAAGIIMGLLATFKPNLLLLPALLGMSGLFSRRWREVFTEASGFAIGAAWAVGISSCAFGGPSCWLAWGRIMLDLGSRPTMPSVFGNFSLTRNIYEATGKNLIPVFSATGLSIAIIAIWIGRRPRAVGHGQPQQSRRVGVLAHHRLAPGESVGEYTHPTITATTAAPDFQSASIDPGRRCRMTRREGTVVIFASRQVEFRHDLAIFGIAASLTLLTSGLAWVHYPILLFPFLLLAASPMRHRQVHVPAEVLRYGLVLLVIILLMYPPLSEIREWLPFSMAVTDRAWFHCSQAAVVITFALGLCIEAIYLKTSPQFAGNCNTVSDNAANR